MDQPRKPLDTKFRFFEPIELHRALIECGLDLSLEKTEGLCGAAESRVNEPLSPIAIERAVLAYLFELCNHTTADENAIRCGVAVASALLAKNGVMVDRARKEGLEHTARIIREHEFSWDDVVETWLPPGPVNLARIKKNLAMTPTERLERHNSLAAQLRILRNAQRRNKSA